VVVCVVLVGCGDWLVGWCGVVRVCVVGGVCCVLCVGGGLSGGWVVGRLCDVGGEGGGWGGGLGGGGGCGGVWGGVVGGWG